MPGNKKVKIKVLHTFKEKIHHELIQKILSEHLYEHDEVAQFHSQQEAAEHLEFNSHYDLIILEQKNESTLMSRLIFTVAPKSTYILCGTQNHHQINKEGIPDLFSAPLSNLETSLDSAFNELTNLKPHFRKQFSYSACASIPIEMLPTLIDSKIRTYVRSVDAYKPVNLSTMTEFAQNQLKEIWIRQTDHSRLIQFHADQMGQSIAAPEVDEEEVSAKIIASQAIVRDMIAQAGFSDDAVKIAKSSVELGLRLIGSKPRLSDILVKLRSKEGNYLAQHSLLLGQLVCAMAHDIGWNSPSTFFKLTLASFMHDITLSKTEHAKVNSLDPAKSESHFSLEEYKAIKNHPVAAAEYTRKFTEIPSDVDQIVLQHHERSDGSGFPRGLNARYISPISALFIIAHQFLDATILNPELTIDSFLEELNGTDPQGAFKKIINSLTDKVPLSTILL